MTRVGVGELRDRVSRYVRRAERGETIVIVNRVVGDIVRPAHDQEDWFRT